MVVQYLHLIKEIDHQVQALQQQSGDHPCPTDCYDCCRNTATMAISAVEAQHLSIGLKRLSDFVLGNSSFFLTLMTKSKFFL